MHLNEPQTELTTAATDALLGRVSLTIIWWLADSRPSWTRAIWIWLFALMSLASMLGAAAHGLMLSDRVRGLIWQPLYLSLGVTIALFVVAGVSDWRGESAARALLPWAIAVGVGFYALTTILSGAFVIFVAYEAVAMCLVLAMYVGMWLTRSTPGSPLIVLGVAISIVAAAVQASSLSARLVVTFDHNGLFHLLQLAGTIALAAGVRLALAART